MSEEKIVEDFDQFWESEEVTFNKFLSYIGSVVERHTSEIFDGEVKSGYIGCLYLRKDLKKRNLDRISKDFYKNALKYFEEPTTKIINKEKGLYGIKYEWSYPTHTYNVAIVYVQDGYEDYYFKDGSNQDIPMHGIMCFLDVNLSEEKRTSSP